jgi:hypothetical protein
MGGGGGGQTCGSRRVTWQRHLGVNPMRGLQRSQTHIRVVENRSIEISLSKSGIAEGLSVS